MENTHADPVELLLTAHFLLPYSVRTEKPVRDPVRAVTDPVRLADDQNGLSDDP